MADRTIIVQYDFKSDEAEVRLAALRAQMQDLKAKQSELDKQRKAGAITLEEYADKTAQNAAEQRALSVDIQATNKALNAQAKANKATQEATQESTGSLNEMRKRLSELKAEYAALSKQERESAKGQELRDKTKALNDEISKLEQGYGVYSRNVGNYTNSVVDALGRSFPLFDQAAGYVESLQQVSQLLVQGYELFGQVVASTSKSMAMMATTEEAAAVAGQMNAIAQTEAAAATAAAGGSANVATKGFQRLTLAMLANPFGLIAVAVVGLIAYLSQFSGALDGLEQMWSGIIAASKPVIGAFGAIGKVVFDLAKTVGGAFVSIGQAMLKVAKGDFQGAKATMVKGFAEVKQGIDNMANGIADARKQFQGLGKAMTDAYNAGSSLRKQLQDLEDDEAKFALSRIDRENQAKKLELAAADRARAASARLRDLQAAGRIQQGLANEEAALARRRYDLMRQDLLANRDLTKYRHLSNAALVEQMELLEKSGKLQGDLAVDVKALADLYKTYTDAQERAANVTLETNAKTGKLRKAIAAEYQQQIANELKASQEQLEFEARKAKVYAEMANDELTKLELSKKAIDAEAEASMNAAKTAEEVALIRAKANFDKIKLEEEYQAKVKQLNEQATADAIAEENKRNDLVVKAIEDGNTRRKMALQQRFADLEISEYELQQGLIQSDIQAAKEQLELLKARGEETLSIEKSIMDSKMKLRQNELKDQEMNARAQYEVARGVAQNLSQLAGMLASQNSEMAEFQKAIALFNIGISTAQAISSVVRIASTTSPDPVTFGISLTTMIATVLGNIAQASAILSGSTAPTPPSFERGGYIEGRNHANGGVTIEAQGGEMIMNRSAVRMAGGMLANLNAAGNGDMMALGAINADAMAMSQRQLIDAIAAMPPQQLNVIDLDRVQTDASVVINNNKLAKSK